jgi:hypothetical protein
MCFGQNGDIMLAQAFADYESHKIHSKELHDRAMNLLMASAMTSDDVRSRQLQREARELLAECDDAIGVMCEAELLLQAAGVNLEPPYSVEDLES